MIEYPLGQSPTMWHPDPEVDSHRFAIGRVARTGRPLVVLAMNPSHARSGESDDTVNRVIRASMELGNSGWIMLNAYPERASRPRDLGDFNAALSAENCREIAAILDEHDIDTVLGAWGNPPHRSITNGLRDVRRMLAARGTRVVTLDPLTTKGHPRHPRPQGGGDLPMLGPESDIP